DLVFLHAGVAHRSMWQPQIDEFSDRYRCTAPDLRGFGDTPIGSEPFSRRDDVAAVMDSVGAETATIIGCSIGAGIALDFAIEHPGRVDRLVLVGGAPAGFDAADPDLERFGAQINEAMQNGDVGAAVRLQVQLWAVGPRRGEDAVREALREQVAEWTAAMFRISDWGDSIQLDPLAVERLDEVAVPTLVIVGAEDVELTLAGSRAIAEGVAGAELVVLDDAAHLPSLEVPERFNAALRDFLDR
ncbi:MAG: alpha/beta fold hydrolase, partial [Actinomycetota bacterium]